MTRILGDSINLVLHGHTHDGKLYWLTQTVPILSTGSAAVVAPARPEEVPNQYQWIRIWPDPFLRWTRQYAANEKRWIGDNRASDDGSTWITKHQVDLQDVAGTFPPHETRAPELVETRRREEEQEREFQFPRLRDDLLSRAEKGCRARSPGAEVERSKGGSPAFTWLAPSIASKGVTSTYSSSGFMLDTLMTIPA